MMLAKMMPWLYAAGLLAIGFLFAFPGGAEFCWGDAAAAAAAAAAGSGEGAATPPSLTMFGTMPLMSEGLAEGLADGLSEVPARQLESGLVCVTMRVNGVEIPSLLDTGSPITVLNAAAAEAAGIEMPRVSKTPSS